MKQLMTGNEAIARGAYEAGVKYASAYPGTPSTEILENIALYKNDIVAEWAPNEKVALESAAGGAFAGARTVASMKHVGSRPIIHSCIYWYKWRICGNNCRRTRNALISK